MSQQLTTSYNQQAKCLQSEIEDLDLKHASVMSICTYIETLADKRSPAQLLSSRDVTTKHIEKLVTMETKQNIEDEAVQFHPSDTKVDDLLGLIRSDVCIRQCTVENIPKCVRTGETVEVMITTRDSSGKQVIPRQDLKVTVTKPDRSEEIVEVRNNRDGTHKVTMNTPSLGNYVLDVRIGDQPIPGTPATVAVIRGLTKILGRQGTNQGELRYPRALAINRDGNLVIAEQYNHRIQIMDFDGNCKDIFTFKQFKKTFTPLGVAISADNKYYMTDGGNKQLVVSDENRKVVRCFGEPELKHPRAISISPLDGTVYVSDWEGSIGDYTDKNTHCVRKYTQEGQYIKSIGKFGDKGGEFKGPIALAIDNQGILFVAEYGNHRVQVFNADDQLLYKFGNYGSGNGQFILPLSLCLDKNRYVYVSDYKKRIQKFDFSGRFICRVNTDEDDLKEPEGLALLPGSVPKIAVCECNQHCIKILEL